MSNYFQTALDRVLKHEGGYANHPDDKGGETTYGITKSTAASFGYHGAMKSIPMSTVEQIYQSKYWDALDCDKYTFALAYQVFDAAVNHGCGNARRMLQRAVGVVDDGVIGKVTIAALQNCGAVKTIENLLAERITHYTQKSEFSTFGKGWMSRTADNLRYAAEDQS